MSFKIKSEPKACNELHQGANGKGHTHRKEDASDDLHGLVGIDVVQ